MSASRFGANRLFLAPRDSRDTTLAAPTRSEPSGSAAGSATSWPYCLIFEIQSGSGPSRTAPKCASEPAGSRRASLGRWSASDAGSEPPHGAGGAELHTSMCRCHLTLAFAGCKPAACDVGRRRRWRRATLLPKPPLSRLRELPPDAGGFADDEHGSTCLDPAEPCQRQPGAAAPSQRS